MVIINLERIIKRESRKNGTKIYISPKGESFYDDFGQSQIMETDKIASPATTT